MVYKAEKPSNETNKQTSVAPPKKTKKIKISSKIIKRLIIFLSSILLFALILLSIFLGKPLYNYIKANSLMSDTLYTEAIELFSEYPDFLNSGEKVQESYFLGAKKLIQNKGYVAAAQLLPYITIKENSDEIVQLVFDGALSLYDSGKYQEAADLVSTHLSQYDDQQQIFENSLYQLGVQALEQQHYSLAFSYLIEIPKDFLDTEQLIVSAQTAYYDNLIVQYEALGIVPEGFDQPILQGFKDSDNFFKYRTLQQTRWNTEENVRNNLELIYDLGDFEGIGQTQYLYHRLVDKRYTGGGYFFEMDTTIGTGDPEYNIPGYVLPGYYGLYTSFQEDIMYIGSDELAWTKQFRFDFSDRDQVVTIYSFMTNSSYTLYLEQ